MQRDQHYYSRFDPNQDLPLLRFYSWQEPTVSLGRFQTATAAFAERLRTLSLPTVQRPTGGKAILHAGDLTFSLVGPASWMPGKLLEGHAFIRQALQTGLQKLGVSATGGLAPAQRQQAEHCFATATAADLLGNWGKLVGTAQVRRRQAFLLQGTLYLKANRTLLQAVFDDPSEAASGSQPGSEVMDLAQVLGMSPSEDKVIAALAQGFSEVLGLSYVDQTSSDSGVL